MASLGDNELVNIYFKIVIIFFKKKNTTTLNNTFSYNIQLLPGKSYNNKAYSRLVSSQRETSLQSNAVSHSLGANLESTL